jgi:C-terminal processing protease CtpA/Prc
MMIVAPGTVTVVGRTSAGTTGSVTGMQLPGGFAVFLTGMEARWPDGSTFFASGVIPDVLVTPAADDFAAGRDPFLEAALAAVER